MAGGLWDMFDEKPTDQSINSATIANWIELAIMEFKRIFGVRGLTPTVSQTFMAGYSAAIYAICILNLKPRVHIQFDEAFARYSADLHKMPTFDINRKGGDKA